MQRVLVFLALVAGASGLRSAGISMAAKGKAVAAPTGTSWEERYFRLFGVQKDPSKVSEALPFTSKPEYLDGTLVGDVGFDPARLVTLLSEQDSGPLPLGSLKWKREAELQHGRVAQLAFLGALFPNLYHFTSDATHDFDELNPLVALEKAPQWGFVQMAMFVGAFEYQRYRKCIVGDNAAGDVGLGQGGFNPFGFDYTEEEFEEKQLQEIKHCRLAMVGLLAAYFNDFDFTLAKFTQPDYIAKAGYYFPEGL